MWLTQQFEFPDWETENDFQYGGVSLAWHDSSNPAPRNNTGQSVIRNHETEITIDYEVVDLESMGTAHSPMTYLIDPNTGSAGVIYSDRYVFLQTYAIRNLDPNEPLNNLEFYQFLHSHGADEYGPRVNSTYMDASVLDPLASYTPINPVHQTGNFRYDITQWNVPPYNGNASHTDFVGFSSVVEPDWVDTDAYRGGHCYYSQCGWAKPDEGTHVHIENRSLNGTDHIYNDEVGGAMGWSLGSLDPNETVSLTVAFMFAPDVETSDLILTKVITDPNDCYSPGDKFTYTICWQNVGQTDAENAVLVDYLPEGVTYPVTFTINPDMSVSSSDPNYNDQNHTYTWNLGTIPAQSSGCVDLTVIVNEKAEPGMNIVNEAFLTTSIGHVSASYETPICCWDDGEVIYVDLQASGANTGLNWQDAYTDLQRALERAQTNCIAKTIYVTQGVYDPGRLSDETFVIPDGVSVYGGFPAGGCAFNQRNPQKYRTILAGDADDDRNDIVVTMGDNTRLEGCTVTGASDFGIYGNGVDFIVENCIIENNDRYGILARNGNVTIQWCVVTKNKDYGVRHDGEGYTLTVENTHIIKNDEYGIYCLNSTPTVINSIVSENDFERVGREGIRLINPTYPPVLHNNTFAYNRAEAILFTDDITLDRPTDPNFKDWPDVQNCILWYNNDGGEQYAGFEKSCIYYSCVYDPNNPEGSLVLDGQNNFSAKPKFAYLNEPNNVHIAWDSPCKDMGNPDLLYTHQVDMDQQVRVAGIRVDIGADEASCGDVAHPLDWDADGLVNYDEFDAFSRSWLSRDPNDPSLPTDPNLIDPNDFHGWNPLCDLNGDYLVNLTDLSMFCEDDPQVWLWTACWKKPFDCGDDFHVLDWNADGLVNMTELSLFSSVWQSFQPADPVWQFCNLDDTGDSEGIIDLADLEIFLEDWLWVACWRTDLPGAPDQQPAPPDPNEPEPTILEQALELNESICFLWDLWQNDPNMQQQTDPNQWQGFMDTLCDELDTLIDSMTAFEQSIYYALAGEDCCEQQMMMSGGGSGGESMMSMQSEIMSFSVEAEATLEEKIETAKQLIQLETCVEFLEKIWLEDPLIQQEIDTKSWQEFMDAVYDQLQVLWEKNQNF